MTLLPIQSVEIVRLLSNSRRQAQLTVSAPPVDFEDSKRCPYICYEYRLTSVDDRSYVLYHFLFVRISIGINPIL